MKYKVGDRVKISNVLKGNYADKMLEWCGKTMTITDIECENCYWMKEDNGGWCWYDDIIEGLVNKNYDIFITTKGTTIYAFMQKDGKIIKKSKARLNPNDKFDFKIGSDIAYNRLFEKETEFVPCLKSIRGDDYGKIGKPTNLIDFIGNKLCVGDVVKYSRGVQSFTDFVVDTDNKIGVMGILEDGKHFINGITNNWIIVKIKSYKDLKYGEKYSFVRAELEKAKNE